VGGAVAGSSIGAAASTGAAFVCINGCRHRHLRAYTPTGTAACSSHCRHQNLRWDRESAAAILCSKGRYPVHCLHPGFITNTRVGGCHKLVQTHPVCLGPRCGGTYIDDASTTKKGCCPYTATMKCATSSIVKNKLSRDVKGLVSSHLFSLVRGVEC
jgi:hypothetical protein